MRKWHKDWLKRKVIIQDRYKIAGFLWPKFNQLRMLSLSDRNAAHAYAHSLLQAMAAEFFGVEPTLPAKRVNFAEWENVRKADWEDDKDTR